MGRHGRIQTARGPGPEAGFTLMELVVVMVLAGIVTLGLVVFYLNSQATWMDASTQALAQRDATTLIEAIRAQAGPADTALVLPNGANHHVILYRNGDVLGHFLWDPSDSLVHYSDSLDVDRGPVVSTIVERFHASMDPTLPLLRIDTLRVRSTTHQTVQMSATMALYNGTPR